jgi:integrase
MLDADVDLRDVQIAARHADPRTTMRYDRARQNLDRHGSGLANPTILQRLVPVRLFYDFLTEEGLRQSNPVGRGRYTPGRPRGSRQRGPVPRLTKLPWIPTEQEWLEILAIAAREPVRNRLPGGDGEGNAR